MSNRGCGLLLLCMPMLLGAASAAGTGVVTEYDYVADQVYTLRTGLGLTSQIELDPDETVQDFSTGFSSGWALDRRDNVFYLKPKDVDVDTNLLIRTDRHDYIFELRVVATDWKTLAQAKKAGVQYKVRFRYPDAKGQSRQRPAATGAPSGTALIPGRAYNFNYDIKAQNAQRWLTPINVHDDGRFTYIRLNQDAGGRSGNFPAVFSRETERGEEAVVNSSVRGTVIVVHGIHPYLVLRHGRSVVALRRNTPR